MTTLIIFLMSTPDVLPGFVKITDVKQEYLTSRKTVERRRDRARERGDAALYRMFKLRTKDGAVLVEPTIDQVHALTREGRVPEWFVSRVWLEKEFGERSGEPSRHAGSQPGEPPLDTNSVAIVALQQQYEARINDLKEQLEAAARREEKALEYAERDKQRFAAATTQLTQVLALPGITEASRVQNATPKNGVVVEPTGVPHIEPASRIKPSSTAKPRHTVGLWQRVKNALR